MVRLLHFDTAPLPPFDCAAAQRLWDGNESEPARTTAPAGAAATAAP
ncbi:hypothetical protein [Pseudoduganella flava]|uniref:Uncharacterized protein n=1 Tax=Pseudoduganella flava TaxID=871742 RepID=A0ABX6FUP5_9BURK|nr:hypothetical protein [Pseudoduganella flava]QGZ41058.1 hypothetical protein GO485_19635 [Pseudoduganella flava]